VLSIGPGVAVHGTTWASSGIYIYFRCGIAAGWLDDTDRTTAALVGGKAGTYRELSAQYRPFWLDAAALRGAEFLE
jgi:hypothetical protein